MKVTVVIIWYSPPVVRLFVDGKKTSFPLLSLFYTNFKVVQIVVDEWFRSSD
jgi:hypothetical protein